MLVMRAKELKSANSHQKLIMLDAGHGADLSLLIFTFNHLNKANQYIFFLDLSFLNSFRIALGLEINTIESLSTPSY